MMSRWLSIPYAVIVATATLMSAPGSAHSSDTVGDPASGQKSRDQLQKRADATSFDGGTGQLRRLLQDGQPLHQQRPDATSSDGSADHDRWPSEVAVKRASVFTEFERRVRPSTPQRTGAPCPHVLAASSSTHATAHSLHSSMLSACCPAMVSSQLVLHQHHIALSSLLLKMHNSHCCRCIVYCTDGPSCTSSKCMCTRQAHSLHADSIQL
jgi:hypothetical protein